MALVNTVVAMLLFIFSVLAGCSKFGPWLDAYFLPHSFMVDVYFKVGSILGQNSEMLRYSAGASEFVAAALLLSPSTRKVGASILSLVMCFAFLCHQVLQDPIEAYLVPGVIFILCSYLISSKSEIKATKIEKKRS